MSPRPDYEPEKRARAVELYRELGTMQKVADAMELSLSRVAQLIDDAGYEVGTTIRKKRR